jgi:hypothetical protein
MVYSFSNALVAFPDVSGTRRKPWIGGLKLPPNDISICARSAYDERGLLPNRHVALRQKPLEKQREVSHGMAPFMPKASVR